MGGPVTTRTSAMTPSGTTAPGCRQRSLGSAVKPFPPLMGGDAVSGPAPIGMPRLAAPEPLAPMLPIDPPALDGDEPPGMAPIDAEVPAPEPVGSTPATDSETETGTRMLRSASGSARYSAA